MMRLIPLFSGSSGNCCVLEGGGVRLLIDAGLPGRTITGALRCAGIAPETLDAILITHEHSDHIRGVGVLSRRYGLAVYANAGTWEAMTPLIGEVPPGCVRVFETDRDFYLGKLNVLPFKTPHDAAESVGYSVECEGRRISFLTDVGCVQNGLLDAVAGSDLVLIEANHDVEMLKSGPYPYPLKRRILSDTGHLSNECAGRALVKLYSAGVKNAILGHLSKENNYEALALEAVRAELRQEDIPDEAVKLCVAHRERITGIFDVE